jgi:AcrR family transcriptional regulator
MPKQERSRRLVDAIVEAAQLVLAESGTEALTTVNVAQRAGVSVGSLYQYFAGRDALVFAVLEAEVARFRAAWRAWRDESADVAIGERIAAGIELALAHYRRLARTDPAFFLTHRVEIRRALRPARARTRARARLGTREDLLRSRSAIRPERFERLDVASFLMTHGIPGLLDAALAHQPELLFAPEFEAELKALVADYLLAERPRRA